MRQNAKEVKVIHRWRADEFDGEIPIGGDEEMLGTAMKVASHVNGISDAVESAMPVFRNTVWLNAHIAGPFLGVNAAYKLGSDDFDSWKVEGGKLGYSIGSLAAHTIVNGGYGSIGGSVRGVSMIVGSMLLGIQTARKKLGHTGRESLIRNTAIGCYTVAGASYAYKKFMGGR